MKKLISVVVCAIMLSACTQGEKPDSGDQKTVTPEAPATTSTDSEQTSIPAIKEEKPEYEGKVVIIVNDVPIHESELKNKHIHEGVTDEILYQYGLSKGIDKKYAKNVYEYKKQLVVNDVKLDIMENLPPAKVVSDEEIEEYYEQNKSKYTFANLAEITFKNEDLSDEIMNRIKEGEDLQNIAKSYQDSGESVTYNDLGINRSLSIRYDLTDKDQVTEVIRKDNGDFSIIKVLQVRDMGITRNKSAIRNILEAKNEASQIHERAREIADQNNMKVEYK